MKRNLPDAVFRYKRKKYVYVTPTRYAWMKAAFFDHLKDYGTVRRSMFFCSLCSYHFSEIGENVKIEVIQVLPSKEMSSLESSYEQPLTRVFVGHL